MRFIALRQARAGVAGYPDERCGPPVGRYKTKLNFILRASNYFSKELI